MFERSSGILLHPTSLPGEFGIGDLGPKAYDFINDLVLSGQKLWQVLPLGPTGYGNSPYASYSAFAGNTNLISPELLMQDGYLNENDLKNKPNFDGNKIDYSKLTDYKDYLFRIAFNNFKSKASKEDAHLFSNFCTVNHYWLHDFSLFMSLKKYYSNQEWSKWDKEIIVRNYDAINQVNHKLGDEIFFHKFLQYEFYKQWINLKKYANSKNIKIIGDIPIFVAYDSADVWSNPDIFLLDKNFLPIEVAGVPPDYFSETGQLWGNPLYNWDKLSHTNFDWWIKRFEINFTLFDIVRVDHFRGFESFWAIPYGSENAIKGKWKKAKGKQLFKTIEKVLGKFPIIAEDLGVITPEVEALRDTFNFPGMKILQFAFSDDAKNPFLPHNHIKNCVVYPGTHDNDTCWGWFNSCNLDERDYFLRYSNSDSEEIHWDFIRLSMSSVADMSIIPMQDLLGLDSEARMNMPSRLENNWEWRYKEESLTSEILSRLLGMTKDFNR
jgi:4-alpha-glucanotransferase